MDTIDVSSAAVAAPTCTESSRNSRSCCRWAPRRCTKSSWRRRMFRSPVQRGPWTPPPCARNGNGNRNANGNNTGTSTVSLQRTDEQHSFNTAIAVQLSIPRSTADDGTVRSPASPDSPVRLRPAAPKRLSNFTIVSSTRRNFKVL